MHPNPAFRPEDDARALAFAQTRGFGVLTLQGSDAPLASHVPFTLGADRIGLHLVRSNPIARLLTKGGAQALLIVSGPDSYISPDWYGLDDQVPTWNYVAVHIRGSVSLLPNDRLLGHLEGLSASNEARLAPKKPWHHSKMSPGALDRMMRQIVPAEMTLEQIDSTFKLNQNKPEGARLAAAESVATTDIGYESAELAHLMRSP